MILKHAIINFYIMPKQTIHKAKNFNLVFDPGLIYPSIPLERIYPLIPLSLLMHHANESESEDDKRTATEAIITITQSTPLEYSRRDRSTKETRHGCNLKFQRVVKQAKRNAIFFPKSPTQEA